MDEKHKMQPFENIKIRTAWDEDRQEWFISIVDVIAVMTDQPPIKDLPVHTGLSSRNASDRKDPNCLQIVSS